MTTCFVCRATGTQGRIGIADFGSGQTRKALARAVTPVTHVAPQPGSGQAREEWCFLPLPGEPYEGFRPLRATRSCHRLRTVGEPGARRRPLSGGSGASRPVVVLTNGDRCLVPGDDRWSFGTVVMRHPRLSARRDGLPCREHGGCGTELVACLPRFLFGFFAGVRRIGRGRESPRSSGRTLEGNEAHGRTGHAPTGNGRCRVRTRRRSNASKSTAPGFGAPKLLAGNGGEGRSREIRWRTARGQRPR